MLLCSCCRRMLPATCFSPKKHHETAHRNKAGARIVYRNRCARGRHYLCHECRRAKWREAHPIKLPCCYKGCGKESVWRDPIPGCRWSACDKHKIPGDVRI